MPGPGAPPGTPGGPPGTPGGHGVPGGRGYTELPSVLGRPGSYRVQRGHRNMQKTDSGENLFGGMMGCNIFPLPSSWESLLDGIILYSHSVSPLDMCHRFEI